MEKNKTNIARTIAIISCVYMLCHVLILDWGDYIDCFVYFINKLINLQPRSILYFPVDMSGLFVLIGTAFILYALLTEKPSLLPVGFLIMLPGPSSVCLYTFWEYLVFKYFKPPLLPSLLSLLGLAVASILLVSKLRRKNLWFIPCLFLGIALLFPDTIVLRTWYLPLSFFGNNFVKPVRIAILYLFSISATVLLGAICYYRAAAATVPSIIGTSQSTSATALSTNSIFSIRI